MSDETLVTLNATVLPEQKAMLIALAKDEGMASISEALRRVLSEWRQLRAKADGVALPAEAAA